MYNVHIIYFQINARKYEYDELDQRVIALRQVLTVLYYNISCKQEKQTTTTTTKTKTQQQRQQQQHQQQQSISGKTGTKNSD